MISEKINLDVDKEEISIKELLFIIRSQIKIIFLFLFIFLFIGFVYLKVVKSTYDASATIIIEAENSSVSSIFDMGLGSEKNYLDKKFYHIGPPRDFDLFLDFEKNKAKDINESYYLLCTGLFEDKEDDLNYYKELFKEHLNKKMICTNPDLIVDKGNKRELCAGSVAQVYEQMGGNVIHFGKPYSEVYNQAIDNKNKKVL